MASVTYTQQVNAAALHAQILAPGGGSVQHLLRLGKRVETQAKRNLNGGASGPRRIDTGRLRASITTVFVQRNGGNAVLIGTNLKYAIFVHYGTGLYGPKRRMILPVARKALRWKAHQGGRGKVSKGGWVFSMHSRGAKPNRFLTDALHTVMG